MKEEKYNVRIYVVNSNTGHVVRSEFMLTNEALITIAERYKTKDSIIITLIPDSFYCFYITDEAYFCEATNDILIIDFFKDVLGGLYDDARDSFHIEYGRVSSLWQPISDVDSRYVELLNCIYNIWETRYYSRYFRRNKHD